MHALQHVEITRPVAFLGMASTGTSPRRDRILELAIIAVHPDEKDKPRGYVRYFNPGVPFSNELLQMDQMLAETPEDVITARPKFFELAESIDLVLDGCDLVGVDLKSYMLPMLIEEFRRTPLPFTRTGRSLLDLSHVRNHMFHKIHRGMQPSVLFGEATVAGDVFDQALSAMEQLDAFVRDGVFPCGHLATIAEPYRSPDLAGLFAWDREGRPIVVFGEHCGELLQDVLRNDFEPLRNLVKDDLMPRDSVDFLNFAADGAFDDVIVPGPKKIDRSRGSSCIAKDKVPELFSPCSLERKTVIVDDDEDDELNDFDDVTN